jgi:prepilin-type N-terminal cleavage/methylation domain-containing protein
MSKAIPDVKAAKLSRRIRRQAGYTLLELLIVLVVIAAGAVATLALGGTANVNAKINDLKQETGFIQDAVHNLYTSDPNHTGLLSTVLATSGQFPNRWKNAALTDLVSPFGAVTVTPLDATSGFVVIAYTTLPQSACVQMLSSDWGTGVINVNATTTGSSTVKSYTAAQAIAACASAGNANSMSLTFQ